MKKVLITGGAGYVGSVLVEKLLEKGYFVRVLDQLIFGKESLDFAVNNPNFELIVGRIEDPYIVEKSVQGMDAVIHLAALANDPTCDLNPSLTRQTNYEATRSLIDSAKKAKVSRFLFASSCSVYGFTGDTVVSEESALNPLTAYARSKVRCEGLISDSAADDFDVVCLRKATIYGPSHRMRFDLVINTMTGSAITNKKIQINGGKQWRPFVHIEDVADAYIFLLEAPKEKIKGQIFNIGSNEQNHQIEKIANFVKDSIPKIEIEQSGSPDPRSYHVSFDKINKLGFKTQKTVKDGVLGIKKLFDDQTITNFRDINYYNVKRMISFLNI